jgi:hypothetical protein
MQSMVEGAGRSSDLIAAAIVSDAFDQECRASCGSVDYFAAARERPNLVGLQALARLRALRSDHIDIDPTIAERNARVVKYRRPKPFTIGDVRTSTREGDIWRISAVE